MLSKLASAIDPKGKTCSEVAGAFKIILEDSASLRITDGSGKRIFKPAFKQAVKTDNVHRVITNNEVKASAIGHFNRMLKTKMWRCCTTCNTSCYVDVLSKFIKSHNHSFHHAIRARHVDTNTLNSARVWKTLYGVVFKIKASVPLLKKGDLIRESRTKGRFEKGYEQMFADEIFIVAEIVRRGQLPAYYLTDYDHKAIEGSFYPEELQKMNPDKDRIYRIGKNIAAEGKGRKKTAAGEVAGLPPEI